MCRENRMSPKPIFKWMVGGVAAALVIAVVSGRFGLWTPPMMLLGPPLFTLLWR